MTYKTIAGMLIMLLSFFNYSQDRSLIALTIPKPLKENANAVVRKNDITIDIASYNKMIVRRHRIVTVLNEQGNNKAKGGMSYDNTVSIKKIEAKIYNALGVEIKKYKKNDFEDVSIADGVSIFNDNRAKYFNYTPISYPYTLEYIEESIHTTTAFIQTWRPLEGFYVSTQESNYRINNTSGINLEKKASNFEGYEIIKNSDFHYTAKNILAVRKEAYSTSIYNFAPNLKVALQEFDMKGVKGTNTGWKDFGKWVDDYLIKDTKALPENVKTEVLELTKEATTDLEKAKLVYQYMQDKTRYISVQVGIGGWKPMLASDVDRLGYGDCKALSNYTKSLLEVVGVESYYTLINGGRDVQDIDKDFSSQQGNHAILTVPNNEDYIFLECTSQTTPFGYTANFTDDRDALIITPEGGKIIHTNVYDTTDNLQTTKAKVKVDALGTIKAEVSIVSEGTQYSHHEGIQNESKKEKESYYKNYLDNINNIELLGIKFHNDKNEIKFTEEIALNARKYGTKTGSLLLMAPNMFNKIQTIPPRYDDRKLPFEIDRGFLDIDETEIVLDSGMSIEALKEPVVIKNKFGEYHCEIKKISDTKLMYTRKLLINKGKYTKEEYSAYRDFFLDIVKHDKSKIALKTI